MAAELPRLEFHGQSPLVFPGVGRVIRDPTRYWPPEILQQSVTEARAGGKRLVLLASPESVSEILLNQGGGFPRARLHDRMLGASYGDNLVRGDRADWRQQRRQVMAPFQAPEAAAPEARIAMACRRIVDEWGAAADGQPVDILRDARRLTLDSLWRSFFCDEASFGEVEPLVEETALTIDAHEDAPLIRHLEDLRPLAALARQREQARLSGRTDADDSGLDLNTMLLFLHAGHDNVAATLAWVLWLMAQYPQAQARVREEWRRGRAQRARGGLDSEAYPLSRAVISETLRLYPPIMHLIREVTTDIEVEGQTLAGGFTTVLSLYAMHRNRQWWDRPDAFEPSRFLEGGNTVRHRSVWLPFGTGPRGCVGSMFARTELILAVGSILERFELLPNPGHPMGCRVDFVLRPVGRQTLLVRPIDETRAT
ncbi:MAG: cytochrome P450 [Brevundimonas sp.]|jgi:cytochrome P450|uniref:cytochrome P450 n=1 Tax=Brevundimonas sp. TaxID=1871086 RepID=UPI0039E727F5